MDHFDVCKHCHAARLYKESLNAENLHTYIQEVKNKLAIYFKNKERAVPVENKNKLIYEEDIEVAYNEILRLFELKGIFYYLKLFLLIFEYIVFLI